ncbi:MAG: hypothetical protein B6U97_03110 [Candidatus Altiarchaeales archaeon ex4484_96]|nr:MAG: hypothetical protein B6U97_03110 [Candidatus Altiarchaeales archaeon ex4484_96]
MLCYLGEMAANYFNLRVGWNPEIRDNLDLFESLGWNRVCFFSPFVSGFSVFAEEVKSLGESSNLRYYCAALVDKPVRKNARKALKEADFVYALGNMREASECWEVDMLCIPHQKEEGDYMKQRNSGIDHIIARNMAERFIALELNFSDILHTRGRERAVILGRMRQNIRLAHKYDIPLVLTTGSDNLADLRTPMDMLSLARLLGLKPDKAKDTLYSNPNRLLKKSADRRDPNVILKGLKVLDWGNLDKPKEKKMFGWY